MELGKMLNVRQAAAWLGLSDYYVRTNSGELGLEVYRTPSGHRRYDPEQVGALAARLRAAGDRAGRWSR